MAMVRPSTDWGRKHAGTLGRGVVLCALLSAAAACIPSSGKYPYVGPNPDVSSDIGIVDATTDVGDAAAEIDAARDTGDGDVDGDAAESGDACIEVTDEELCADKCGTVTTEDLCGRPREVVCPGCRAGTVCNAQTNACCEPESDASLCDSYGARCGTLSGLDNCGQPRQDVECENTCDEPTDCDGTTCGECIRETDAEFCARYNYQCGVLEQLDNCRRTYQTTCGECSHGSNCMNGVCVCPGGSTETNCGDGADNDCDGLIDCHDPDCDQLQCGTTLLGTPKRCRDNMCSSL